MQPERRAGPRIAKLAHELNNPLAYLRANLSQLYRMGELVEAWPADASEGKLAEELRELREIAEETLDGIARIEHLVRGLREVGADVDAVAPSRPDVDANAVVRDALRLSNLAREPDVVVEERLSRRLPTIPGDAERLVQALLNLLLNARQAVAGGGRVQVSTRGDSAWVEIRVSDDGPGVPPELAERIFEPFVTTRGPDGGSGLGLAIVREIANAHGGALELRPGAGPGACFALRLPVAD